MSYREVPAWLGDADPTVLLDDEEMTPESVTDSEGTWTAETDAGPVEVRLAWDDRLFTHASATLAEDEFALYLSSEDPDADPVFTPETDCHECEVRLVADAADRGDADRRADADRGGADADPAGGTAS